jgi:hypothetical protein
MNEELLDQEEHKNPFDGFKDTLKNFEWGISLSVGGYLFLIFLGLSYNFSYFLFFKVNIFLFSEINDFLMAPLANPLVILLGALSAGLVFFLMYLGFSWQKKHYKSYSVAMRIMMLGKKVDQKKIDKLSKSPVYISIMLVVYLFYAAFFYGQYRSKKTYSDKNLFHYKLSVDNEKLKNIDSLIYVGDNSAHYFLYDTVKRQATVIPKSEVKFVRIVKNPKGVFF